MSLGDRGQAEDHPDLLRDIGVSLGGVVARPLVFVALLVAVPLRTPGGYRRFTLVMLEDIALSCYRHGWFSMDKLKSIYRELLMAAYRDTGQYKIPS